MKKKNKISIYPLIAAGIILTLIAGCNDGNVINDNISMQRNSRVYTTLERTIMPISVPSSSLKIFPYEVAKYAQYGYGVWQYGPGIGCEKRVDLMPANYNSASVTNAASLLNFFALTDVHIMDKETPAQAIYFGYKGNNPSAYSATMLYTTQVLDAAIGTINSLNKNKQFDFGIALGDNTNSNQYNEMRWFVDVLDGKFINPDSGVKDDPVPGPNNDYQDEFKAEGLDRSIPWYQVLGNHDHLWLGSYPANNYIKQYYLGENIIDMGDIFNDPLGIESRGVYGGAIDGRTRYGEIIGAGLVSDFSTPPKVHGADSRRRYISKEEWRSEFLNSYTAPLGHGIGQQSPILGCYTFEPKANLPLKVIVLDDTQREDDFDIHEHGYVDQERYNWLVSELDKGQSEGKLMIIASHIPLMIIGYNSHSPIPAASLISKLHTYPNFIMWIAGHVHRNKITPFKSPNSSQPELGFWHVETSSLRDFPQQFRTFEIVRNSDNNISIFATNVDPDLRDKPLAAISRSYAIATCQIENISMTNASYNAELVKQLSTDMQNKIKTLGRPIYR